MAELLRGLFKRRALRSDVSQAIESRVGFYEATFPLTDSLANEFIAWCRETVAHTNRPYGVDYLTLGVALEGKDGSCHASATFRVLRPIDFYDCGSAARQVKEAIEAWRAERMTEPHGESRLHAILFSWGDLTRELLRAS